MLKERPKATHAPRSMSTSELHRDFAQLQIGLQKLTNVVTDLGTYTKINSNYGNKAYVLRSIYNHNYEAQREISRYFYESSGIYQRLCKYLATLYRYDWFVTPYILGETATETAILREFGKVLMFLDNSNIKRLFGNIALDIITEGVYYGIILDFGDRFSIQKLPADYCRVRYFSGVDPVVELNLQFFDAFFTNPQYKLKILSLFPAEVRKAYIAFKEGKLKGDYPGDRTYWFPLEVGTSIRLSLNNSQVPCLIGVIPSIIDLDQAQDLDRKRMMQQLLKILIQKLPLDKNGDLVFDLEEARDIHNNAVNMLKRAMGFEVLTTFADVIKIDAKDANSSTTIDELEKIERTVYNNSGVTHNLFNTEGNLATANSILSDEAFIRDLPLQFEYLLNRIVKRFGKKQYNFRVTMLETTQYNYKELSKMYKEQTQIGYSKMLPQIALGHSQSTILASLNFENEILHLAEIMIPPMSSNTMSGKNLGNEGQSNQNKIQDTQQEKAGRPEKEDSEKSDKTIANRESES